MSKQAAEIKRAYRKKRDEELQSSIPKVTRKIRMIDPMTDETWNSGGGNLNINMRGSPGRQSQGSVGNASMGS